MFWYFFHKSTPAVDWYVNFGPITTTEAVLLNQFSLLYGIILLLVWQAGEGVVGCWCALLLSKMTKKIGLQLKYPKETSFVN